MAELDFEVTDEVDITDKVCPSSFMLRGTFCTGSPSFMRTARISPSSSSSIATFAFTNVRGHTLSVMKMVLTPCM